VKGLDGASWRCEEDRPPQCQAGAARAGEPVLLAPFSTGLPPELIDRLRGTTRELGLPESLIATVAIAVFLEGEGF